VLLRLVNGEAIGSFLHADQTPLGARKQWLADNLIVRGRLHLDAGAVHALRHDGKSLLPIGVHALDGTFDRGAVVSCISPEGEEIARGLINYSTADAQRILRTPSHAIEAQLGYVDEPELIHRDNLVLL
jgi:glutamate 5-kinase